ncbi:unnamed protein product, partial [Nesidiocoris tenuis]
RSFGTEDRKTAQYVPPQSQVYDYILFRATDIKDISVVPPTQLLYDPAIVTVRIIRRSDGRYVQIAVVQLAGAIRRRGAGRRGGSGGVGAQRLPSARAGNRKRLGGGRERWRARHVPILEFQPHAVVPLDPPLTK